MEADPPPAAKDDKFKEFETGREKLWQRISEK
jgi:hypothetical protein